MACAAASVLSGCGASRDCDDPRQVPVSSSDSTPGTLQSGLLYRDSIALPIAVRADGSIVCLACSDLVTLDAGLHEIGRADAGDPVGVAVAPDDAIYTVFHASASRGAELVALSPAGQRRWTAPIPSPATTFALVAGPEGPYVGAPVPAGGGSVLFRPTVFGFDAAMGEPRTLATEQYLLGAAHGGVFTAEEPDERSATLHLLDPAGNVVWSHALGSTRDGLQLEGAVATSDGGAIAFGSTQSTLDLGDRTLAITSAPAGFVVGFDAAGATRWAFALDTTYIANIALRAQGEILIAGERAGGSNAEAYVSVATPAGVSRTLDITGTGNQLIVGLAALPDGLAWVQVNSSPASYGQPEPVMQIGDHTFVGSGTYLFKLVP